MEYSVYTSAVCMCDTVSRPLHLNCDNSITYIHTYECVNSSVYECYNQQLYKVRHFASI